MAFDRLQSGWGRPVAVMVSVAAVMTVGAGLAPAAERVVLGEYFTSVY